MERAVAALKATTLTIYSSLNSSKRSFHFSSLSSSLVLDHRPLVQSSNMRNALLPSVSSQLYGFVNNEFQMPNLDISMQMDSKVNHVHGSGFSMDSRLFSDDTHLRSGGGFANPYQSLVNYQPASHLASTFSSDNMSQQAMVLGYKLPCSQFEDPFEESRTMKSTRKRAYEINKPSLQEGIDKTALNEWKKNKRKINTTSMEQIHHQVLKEGSIGTQRHSTQQVPVRRSQKLGDKITALQKLVSPYGKTDTASVLQEASLYIKLLQDQIQMMMTSSYDSVTAIQPQDIREKELDLRSRGLCLVPVSITQELVTKEDMAHHHVVTTSRRSVTPRNF